MYTFIIIYTLHVHIYVYIYTPPATPPHTYTYIYNIYPPVQIRLSPHQQPCRHFCQRRGQPVFGFPRGQSSVQQSGCNEGRQDSLVVPMGWLPLVGSLKL